MRFVVTDLDGTLLDDTFCVSKPDIQVLEILGDLQITRAIATGRSIYSVNNVIPPNFPIDYLVFSSGAGIMHWKSKEIIYRSGLSGDKTSEIIDILKRLNLDFMVHEAIPNNHCFYYHCKNTDNIGFQNRMQIYRDYASPLPEFKLEMNACQFVVILPNDLKLFADVCTAITGVKIIRATSPLNDDHIWLEIFPEEVSKGAAISMICDDLGCKHHDVIAVGNDYNDIDMLEFVGNPFVVENAAFSLKEKYPVVASNNNNGFSEAVRTLICL